MWLQAWQAAAAVQYGGADLERGIAFLLEGALDDQAAAYRFLEAAGNQLPAIDVSGPLQQACHLYSLRRKPAGLARKPSACLS